MQIQKPHLSNAAFPAGFFLLLTAAAYALSRIINTALTDRLSYFSAALLAVIAVMLFTRSRSIAYGWLFLILFVISVIGVIIWITVDALVPFFLGYISRALCFLGMTIVCFRRAYEPVRGPWFLAVLAPCILVPVLIAQGVVGGPEPWNPDPYKISIFLIVTEMLLFFGLLLTAVAFSNAPVNEPKKAAWAPPPVKNIPDKQPSETPDDVYVQKSPQPKPQPAPEKDSPKPAAQDPSIETAEVEWLDEE